MGNTCPHSVQVRLAVQPGLENQFPDGSLTQRPARAAAGTPGLSPHGPLYNGP